LTLIEWLDSGKFHKLILWAKDMLVDARGLHFIAVLCVEIFLYKIVMHYYLR